MCDVALACSSHHCAQLVFCTCCRVLNLQSLHFPIVKGFHAMETMCCPTNSNVGCPVTVLHLRGTSGPLGVPVHWLNIDGPTRYPASAIVPEYSASRKLRRPSLIPSRCAKGSVSGVLKCRFTLVGVPHGLLGGSGAFWCVGRTPGSYCCFPDLEFLFRLTKF